MENLPDHKHDQQYGQNSPQDRFIQNKNEHHHGANCPVHPGGENESQDFSAGIASEADVSSPISDH